MTQITLKIEDALVEQLGKEKIERLIEEWLQQYQRRLALQEAAEELSAVNLSNDPQWQVARSLAWETYRSNFENLAK
jgi:hypothetical protein